MGNCRSTSLTKRRLTNEDGGSDLTSASRRTNASLWTSAEEGGCTVAMSLTEPGHAVEEHGDTDEQCAREAALVHVLPTDGMALLSTPVDRFPVNQPWHCAPHNTSMTTPYVQSMFAYPESPQLMGPRNTDELTSSRQRTGSLPPVATPMSPFNGRNTTSAPYVPITEALLNQLCQPQPPVLQDVCAVDGGSRSNGTGSALPGTIGGEDDAHGLSDQRFVAARRQASIQHVMSWMKSDETFQDDEAREDDVTVAVR